MNEQQKTTQTPVEDLNIPEHEAKEVKGGAVDTFIYFQEQGALTRSSTPSVSEIVVTKPMDVSR